MSDVTKSINWRHLVFPLYSFAGVLERRDAQWEMTHESLERASLEQKKTTLETYLRLNNTRQARVHVTNYVLSLKRRRLIQ